MKGQAIPWIAYITMVAFITIGLVSFTSSVIVKRTNTYDLEFKLLMDRVLDKVSEKDPILGAPNTGIIDEEKFSETTLANELDLEDAAFELNIDGHIIYYNQELFEEGEPIAGLQSPYEGALFTLVEEQYPVVFRDLPAILHVRGIFR